MERKVKLTAMSQVNELKNHELNAIKGGESVGGPIVIEKKCTCKCDPCHDDCTVRKATPCKCES